MHLSQIFRYLIFGQAAKNYRDAVHDSKNAIQVSSGAALKFKKAADEVKRVAECAIERIEGNQTYKDDDRDGG